MEHLNRQLKTILRALGANITPPAVVKAGRTLATVHKVCQVTSSLAQSSDVHNLPSIDEDFQLVLQVIMDENVFQAQEHRYHLSFLFLFKSGLMQSYTHKKRID